MSTWQKVPLPWKAGGLLLGLVFFGAVLLVKPIGVSTQFVIFDGILWDAIDASVVVPSEEAKSDFTSPTRTSTRAAASMRRASPIR